MIRTMNEKITLNEVCNDGKTIHLYFNVWVGLYAAYGISAYLLWKKTKAEASYSDDLQMPVVVMNAQHYEELKQQCETVCKEPNYRRMVVKEKYDEDGYAEWAGELREKVIDN